MNIEQTIKKTGLVSVLTGLLLSCTINSSVAQRQFPHPGMTYIDAHMGQARRDIQSLLRQLEPMEKEPLITPQQVVEIARKLKAIDDELFKAYAAVLTHESEEVKAKTIVMVGELAKDQIIDTTRGFALLFDSSGLSIDNKRVKLSSTLEKKYKELLVSLDGKRAYDPDYYWRYEYGPLNK